MNIPLTIKHLINVEAYNAPYGP